MVRGKVTVSCPVKTVVCILIVHLKVLLDHKLLPSTEQQNKQSMEHFCMFSQNNLVLWGYSVTAV